MSAADNELDLTTTMRRRFIPPPAARRRTLRVVASPDPQARNLSFDLDDTTWTLGRAVLGPGLIRDRAMSREHVRLRAAGPGRYVVEDLGGRNGTFLDGARVTEPKELTLHGVLSVGDTLLVVDLDPERDLLPAAAHADPSAVAEWVGVSFVAQQARKAIATVARANGSVLLLGPTGSGKEVAARAIHRLSGRTGPWVPVNCAAIPADIAEAEFFGYRRGAFTGAITDREGFFSSASGGTLFLDEVGDLPVQLQAKLLRVLEDGCVQALGGGPARKVDLRVVAGTHIDLEHPGFRRDLLARLGDWVLHLPPLAERRADVLPLWEHFVRAELAGPGEGVSPETVSPMRPVTPEFAEALLLHDWPMNVRELQKLARRLVTLAGTSPAFDLPLLPEAMQRRVALRPREGDVTPPPIGSGGLAGPEAAPAPAPGPTQPPPTTGGKRRPSGSGQGADDPNRPLGNDANAPDRATLEAALREARGNVSLVAEQHGWHRTQVYRWIHRARLDPASFR